MLHRNWKKIVAWLLATGTTPAFADTLTIPYTFTPNSTIQSSQMNSNFTAISSLVNGNITNSNIKAAAGIALSKLDLTTEFPILRAAGNRLVSGGVTGDTVPRVSLVTTSGGLGAISFGAGSASAQDLLLKRVDADTLALRNFADSADKNLTVGDFTASGTINVTGISTLGNVVLTSVTSGAWNGTAIAATKGGTGFTSVTAGDMIYASAADTWAKLGKGTALQKLRMNAGATAPEWFTDSSGTLTDISFTQTDIFDVANSTTTPAVSLDNQSYHEVLAGSADPGASDATPSMKLLDETAWFGGASNERPAPTSGTLTGTYYTSGNWTTTNTITCENCRLYFGGTVTINHDITCTALGGAGGIANAIGGGAGVSGGGGGLAPGQGPRGSDQAGGGGGGSYGAGGRGGYNVAPGMNGAAIDPEQLVCGSGGGAGSKVTTSGGNGGRGGSLLYIEARGNVTVNGNITASGATGSNSGGGANDGGGGGGGAGIIDIRSYGAITTNAGKTLTADGGAGGTGTAGGGAGGGGGGGYVNVKCIGSLTDNASYSVAGGAAGTTSANAAAAGSAGASSRSGSTNVYPRRHF